MQKRIRIFVGNDIASPSARGFTTRALNMAAYLGFLTLFPGYAVYHFATASGWILPVFGGLFGGASLVFSLFGLVLLSSYFHIPSRKVLSLEWMFLSLVTYLIVWTAIAGAAIGGRGYAEAAIVESLETVIIWLAVFFVGCRIDIDSKVSRLGVMISGLIIVGLLIGAIIEYQSFAGPFLVLGAAEADGVGSVSTYQGIGRSIMVIAIVAVALQDRLSRALFVLGLATVGLLFLGSRAHFFAMVILFAALIAFSSLKRGRRGAAVLFLLVLAAAAYGIKDVFMETRAAEVFDLSRSTSWQARLDAHQKAVDVVKENPFLGDFGYHHREYEGYAHSALSAWTQFGLLAFIQFVALILYALWVSAKRLLLSDQCSSLWRLAFFANFTALILAVTTETILSSVLPAFGWGLAVNAYRDEYRRREVVKKTLERVLFPGESRQLEGRV